MNREDFIGYLEGTLIPDLIESGHHATAVDFQAAILFLRGSDMVDIIAISEDIERKSNETN